MKCSTQELEGTNRWQMSLDGCGELEVVAEIDRSEGFFSFFQFRKLVTALTVSIV